MAERTINRCRWLLNYDWNNIGEWLTECGSRFPAGPTGAKQVCPSCGKRVFPTYEIGEEEVA